ncbi:Calx-beta domain-containing protein, partial [Serratia bockelmannii]|uniref:Calx-beta domain-containing protein n=1 Tax=Serratia bockelmannii TaxID=2703793 RepID=UPI003B59E790
MSSASANEGASAMFTVRLVKALPGPKTFTYATVDGTAVAGTNYTTSSGSVTFAAGET